MQDFPFQKVYDHFAHPLVLLSPVPREFEPALYIVTVTDEKNIARVVELPQEKVVKFFQGGDGKTMLGHFLRTVNAMAKARNEPVAIVLVTEAWMKVADAKGKTAEQVMREHQGKSIADDPESCECINISIYHHDDMQMGFMTLDAKRNLQYGPLQKAAEMLGRLTPNPSDSESDQAAKAH